jgi:hypothetical protein
MELFRKIESKKMNKKINKIAGWAFIIGAVLINIPYYMLIVNFNYPDILRKPSPEILIQFHNGGAILIMQWLAFAWAGFPILIGIILLGKIFKADGILSGQTGVVFGVLAIIFQLVGLLRWVFVVPVLANQYVNPASSDATKDAVIVVFQVVHQYGGVLIGEHLGQIFTIMWTVFVSITMFKSSIFRNWIGWFGIFSAIIYLPAQAELFKTVLPNIYVLPEAGMIGSILWLVWMIIMGIYLIRHEKYL